MHFAVCTCTKYTQRNIWTASLMSENAFGFKGVHFFFQQETIGLPKTPGNHFKSSEKKHYNYFIIFFHVVIYLFYYLLIYKYLLVFGITLSSALHFPLLALSLWLPSDEVKRPTRRVSDLIRPHHVKQHGGEHSFYGDYYDLQDTRAVKYIFQANTVDKLCYHCC